MESCRACLYTGPDVLNIHKSKCDIVYKECTSLQIDINDDLPHGICLSCYNILNHFYFFKQLSNHSNTILRTKYQADNKNYGEIRVGYGIKTEANQHSSDINAYDKIDIEHVKIECDDSSQTKNVSLNTKREVPQRIETPNIQPQYFNCPVCKKLYKTKKTLSNHLKTHLPVNVKKVYKCDHCSKSYFYKSNIIYHLETHDQFSDIRCKVCKRLFKTHESLKRHSKMHMPVHTKKVYKCDHCLKSCFSKPLLINHLETHKKYSDLKCPLCMKFLKSKRSLRSHLKRHTHVERLFQCHHCLKSYFSKTQLNVHLETHKEFADLECHVCKKLFKTRQTLKHHSKTHLPIHAKKIFRCDYCMKPYFYKGGLISHLQTHLKISDLEHKDNIAKTAEKIKNVAPVVPQKVFECDHCLKLFYKKGNLVTHLEKHKEYPDLQCHICMKLFKSNRSYKGHLKRHLPLHFKRVFKCDHCSKSYFDKHNLIIHLERHKY